MSKKRVLYSLVYGLNELPKTGFKLLVRRDGLRVVGIATVKRPEFDYSLGESRTWVHGVKLDRSFFKEPLDRKDHKLRKLESVVLEETPHMILTARRSSDLNDDGGNFMFLENPLDVEEARKIKIDNEAQGRIISSIKVDFENERKEKEYWHDLAASMGDSVRENDERIRRMSKDLSMSRNQNQHYKMVAEASEAYGILVHGVLDKMITDAKAKGIELASSDTERAVAAAKELTKLKKEFAEIAPRETSEEVGKLKAQLGDARKMIEEMKSKKETKAPPAVAKAKPAEG